MPDYTVDLTDTVDPEFQTVITDGLTGYNKEMGGAGDGKPLTIAIKDQDGRFVGGLLGRSSMGLLFINLFYLPKSLRGSGLGTRILKMAEDEARNRGCNKAVLYTISFQAPDFYKRHGWQVFGEITPNPGATRFFMTKDLAAPTA
ncbi:GNAT family N-acetyltransferase [Bosea caraganae]|uniref:GNAT family N-acetyltransferase n=1 Tax=Bosea caraganae TaxID=2763117 RepID=A0A370LB22_9HYPH|nr:GNAT family N-acetyltransferase [Bosea caraganae]RDJ27114.1 GNAT family N-acetyltransferase [Bosea caraganae]RDJ29131.1 GNAT family N-acetyltransferase [Bosea caraganae]